MLTLRAHHLLCIQGYRGYGYSKQFTLNMDKVVQMLKSNTSILVKIIAETDDICYCCPNRISEKYCSSQYKVKCLDKKVLELLELDKDKVYCYGDILNIIHKKITYESFKNICSMCKWFNYGYCEEGLLGNCEDKLDF